MTLLSARQAAERAGVHVQRIYHLVRDGKLKSHHPEPPNILIAAEELDMIEFYGKAGRPKASP